MKYLALLKDSFVETLDRKSFYVVLILAALLVLLCASIGFKKLDSAGTLNHIVQDFDTFRSKDKTHRFELKFEAKDVVVGESEYRFVLHASPDDEFHKAVKEWNGIQQKPEPLEGEAPPTPDLELRFLKAQFRKENITRSEVEAATSDAHRHEFRVTMPNPRYVTLEGAYEISFLFGAFKGRLDMSMAIFLILVEITVAEWIGGFFGILIAIIFTAGFVPNLLQKGTLDLVLAKPVYRPLVLLAKYAGGIIYVMIPATALIGGCWLAISWRADFFNFGFLASIAVLATVFATLYSFTVLMGVVTRSTIASILLTIGLWIVSFVMAVLTHPDTDIRIPPAVASAVEKAQLFAPRTSELGQVSQYCIAKGNLGPDLDGTLEGRHAAGRVREPKWVSLILSSVGFITAMLALACWILSRRDY
jgi:ABC-type transport system involved in multi-copper enzyme maturation permease subunit